MATPGPENETSREISYTDRGPIGNGSFGIVYQARLLDNNNHESQIVAIKRVLQDKRFKNRELQIMRKLDHCNIVKLLYYFYNSGEKVSFRLWLPNSYYVDHFLIRFSLSFSSEGRSVSQPGA